MKKRLITRQGSFNKGQAALEFLLTYGWAILVVLVVISAMAYFGVLSPSNLLPEKCTFQASFACKDSEAGKNGVQMILQNSAGKDIRVTSVTFSSDALNSLSGVCSTGAISAVVKNGQQAAFYATDPLNCAFKETGRAKNRYATNITYRFQDSTIPHVVTGEIVARAGSGAISGGSGGYGGGSGDASLVGQWKFEEGSGTTAADSSSYGNAGALQGFACTTLDCNPGSGWTSAGRSGKAMAFDGVNDRVDITMPNEPSTTITVEAWLNLRIAKNWNRIVEHPNWATGGTNSWLLFGSSTSLIFGVSEGATQYNNAASAITTNAWVHLAGIYNGTHTALYVNGALAATQDVPDSLTFTNAGRNTLGAAGGGGGNALNGSIDEVAIYNRALSASEIAVLAVP